MYPIFEFSVYNLLRLCILVSSQKEKQIVSPIFLYKESKNCYWNAGGKKKLSRCEKVELELQHQGIAGSLPNACELFYARQRFTPRLVLCARLLKIDVDTKNPWNI